MPKKNKKLALKLGIQLDKYETAPKTQNETTL